MLPPATTGVARDRGGIAPSGLPSSDARTTDGLRIPVGWPLLWALGGYGLAWLLGVRLFVWPAVTLLLLGWLVVHRPGRWRAPAGFGVWLCFLAWTVVSALTIDSVDRLVAWGYRESLYVAATVVLVFCVTAGERLLPTRRIAHAVLWLFGTTVALGTAGLLLPDVAFPTLAEQVLPRSVTQIQFIQEQVAARLGGTADFIQAVRPSAPYGYTNEWGAALGMLWPLALWAVGWVRSSSHRALVWGLIVFAAVPAVVSVNRGLWVSMVLALLIVLLRAGIAGHARLVGGVLLLALGGAVVLWLTPLRDVLLGRLARPNLGTRETLANDAIELVSRSPWFGYGAPQASAVGTNTNDVSVGTHGQLFTLLVSHGLPGTLFYFGFFVVVLVLTVRVSGAAVWAWSAIVVLLVQSLFYNAIPVPLVLGCLAVVVCLRSTSIAPTGGSAPPGPRSIPGSAREGSSPVSQLHGEPERQSPDHQTVDVARYGRGVVRRLPLVLAAAVAGALLGYFFLATTSYVATSTVEVQDGYVSLVSDTGTDTANMVTEQQVAKSSRVVSRAVERLGNADIGVDELLARGEVTTPADSTTLAFSYTSSSSTQAQAAAESWASAYLLEREEALADQLEAARVQALARVEAMQKRLTNALADQPDNTPAGSEGLEAESARSQLDGARLSLSTLGAIDVDPGRQLGASEDTTGLSAPLGAVLGGAAGLVLGAVLALLAARGDRRVRTARDLTAAVGPDVWVDLVEKGDHRALGAVAGRLELLASRGEASTFLLAPLSGADEELASSLAEEMRGLGLDVTSLPAGAASDSAPDGTGVHLLHGGEPLLYDPRSAIASARADRTVLVVDRSAYDTRDVDDAVREVERNRGRVAGVILRGAAPGLSAPRERARRRRQWQQQGRSGGSTPPAPPTPRASQDAPAKATPEKRAARKGATGTGTGTGSDAGLAGRRS